MTRVSWCGMNSHVCTEGSRVCATATALASIVLKRLGMRACLLFATLCASGAANAQPADPPTAGKSETLATGLAIGSVTAGAIAMYAAINNHGLSKLEDGRGQNWAFLSAGLGLLSVGPSAGHIYAGEYRHAVFTSLLRSGGFLAAGAGILALRCEAEVDVSCANDKVAAGLVALGGIAYLAGTFYDLYDSRRAVRRRNGRERNLVIAPSLVNTAQGSTLAIGLGGSF
jgi:hypothetical protein